MRKILLIAFAMLSVLTASSQVDPTLAGMILIYKEKAEKTLKSQESAMLMMTTGAYLDQGGSRGHDRSAEQVQRVP